MSKILSNLPERVLACPRGRSQTPTQPTRLRPQRRASRQAAPNQIGLECRRPRGMAARWLASGATGTSPQPMPSWAITSFLLDSYLLHARQQAADRAVDPIPGAPAPAGVPRLPPLANSAEDDGAPDGVSQLPPSANSVAGDGAVAAPPVAATRKRKGRGKHNNGAKDERKRQRHAAFLLTLRDNTEAGT